MYLSLNWHCFWRAFEGWQLNPEEYLDKELIIPVATGQRNYQIWQQWEAEFTEERESMRQQLTAEQRMQFKREREALVGSLITQEGPLLGGLVKEHVRGSQYVVCKADGSEVFASHKKPRKGHPTASKSLSQAGWSVWDDRG
jgi:hypothetical protein